MSSPTITAGYTFANGELVTPTKANSAQTGLKPQVQTDKLLGRISASTGDWEEVTCTDFAQSFLDDTSAAIARATLGVSDLTSSMSTDKLLGRTTAGAGAPEEVTCTDFGQSLLALADVAALRSTLSLTAPARCTAQTDNTTSTHADVTGMSVNIVSGTTYTLEVMAWCQYTLDGVAYISLKLTGTGTVSSLAGMYFASQSNPNWQATGTSLPITVQNVSRNAGGGTDKMLIQIALTFTCNGSGTLKLQVAQGSGSTTASVLVGSYMKLFAY